MTLRLQDGVRREYCTTTENTTVFFTWTDYVQQVDLLLPIKKMKHLPISVSGALLQERISNTMLAAWASSTACAAMRRNSSSSWPNFRVLFDWPLEKCLYMLDDGRIYQRPGYSSSLACKLPPPSFCVPLPEGNNTVWRGRGTGGSVSGIPMPRWQNPIRNSINCKQCPSAIKRSCLLHLSLHFFLIRSFSCLGLNP